MNFEQEIFKRTHVNFQKLNNYGFQQKGDYYIFSKVFLNDFRAILSVDKHGILTGKVYDLNTEEEYINFRIEQQIGEFVNRVREEYKKILNDICLSCFEKEYFITEQANRITKQILKKYHDVPDFPWKDSPSPGFGIFRNPDNKKWYGLIMNINLNKLDSTASKKEIEAINLKLESSKITTLLSRDGFYPAYHMNKKNWITILLNDTLTDEEVFSFIEESHRYTEISRNWIIPANLKFFDVINYFEKHDTITWKQPKNIHIHDMVYLYLGSPYSAIIYRCEVIDIDIPCEHSDENLSMKQVMQLKLLEKYHPNQYPLEKLKKHGVQAVRSPRSMPQTLEREIISKEKKDE